MAKLRLQIEKKNGNLEIIMRNIISIVIDDVEFKKTSYVSGGRITGEFYSFIKRNKNKVTFISYREYSIDDYVNQIYLKDGKLHCEFDQAFQRLHNGTMINFRDGNYYLNGDKLTYKEWILRLRKIKLQKLSK